MKIFYLKERGSGIVGAQVLTDDGKQHELTTNAKKDGLWSDGKQVIGTLDFSLDCTPGAAKRRLREQAAFRYGDSFGYEEELAGIEESKEALW